MHRRPPRIATSARAPEEPLYACFALVVIAETLSLQRDRPAATEQLMSPSAPAAEGRELECRIEALDTTLFAPIPSQSTPDDRLALLRLHRLVRRTGQYAYLEIGSHLGGSLRIHYRDPRCTRVFSLDARPRSVPDARGWRQEYPGNSSERMRAALTSAYPTADPSRLVVVDSDAASVDTASISPAPLLCFIDGEHTQRAVVADFAFCQRVAAPAALFVFHDADLVCIALLRIQWQLRARGVEWRAFGMGTSVYVLLIGEALDRFGGFFTEWGTPANRRYWTAAVHALAGMRARHHFPRLMARYARWRTGG